MSEVLLTSDLAFVEVSFVGKLYLTSDFALLFVCSVMSLTAMHWNNLQNKLLTVSDLPNSVAS